jgi:hypothetical protein
MIHHIIWNEVVTQTGPCLLRNIKYSILEYKEFRIIQSEIVLSLYKDAIVFTPN